MSRFERLAPALLAALAALAVAGCGNSQPEGLGAGCADREQLSAALEKAPGTVALEGGTSISGCVNSARSDADLMTLGYAITATADRLAEEARGGDRAAALQLGFLVGAADRGASTSQGIQSELAYRLESSARRIEGAGPQARAAFEEGRRAGRSQG
ncbi:MAG: hypothetical protein FGM34_10115 [Solirubrobacteraceae bacterium]|nr:hypothetical protein [Solirubrobacteraceae bacterium]